jgi:hypothetical protein
MQVALAFFVLCFAIFMGHAWPPFGSVLENLCMHMCWRGKKLRPKRLSSHHKRSEAFCANPQHIHNKCRRSAWQTQQKQSWSIHTKRRWYTLPPGHNYSTLLHVEHPVHYASRWKSVMPSAYWMRITRKHIIIIDCILKKNSALWHNKLPDFQSPMA